MRTIVDFSETEGAGALCLLVDRQTGRIWLFYIYCPEGAGAAEICKRKPKTETPVMQTGATPGQEVPTPRAVGEGFEPLPKTPGNTQFTRKLAQNPAQLTKKTVQSMPIFSSSSPSGRSWRPVYGKHSFSRPHSHLPEAPRRASVGD